MGKASPAANANFVHGAKKKKGGDTTCMMTVRGRERVDFLLTFPRVYGPTPQSLMEEVQVSMKNACDRVSWPKR